MKIESCIGELLYHHDCVIVTGLGGFIAQYRPASINPALHVLSPPSKRVAFNAFLQMNDGLLANHIALKFTVDYSEANKQIDTYVNDTLKLMEGGKKVRIEHVGALYFDQEKNIQFSPDQHANFLIGSYGMTPVHAPIIKREEFQRPIPFLEESPRVQVVQEIRAHQKSKGSGWWLIEMIPAAAVIAFLLISPPALNRVNHHLSTLLPFSRMEEFVHSVKDGPTEKTIPTPKPVIPQVNIFDIPPKNPYKAARLAPVTGSVSSNNNSASTPVQPADKNVDHASAAVNAPEVAGPISSTVVTESVETQTYHIIGACFRSKRNAEKFSRQMEQKGFTSSVVGQNSAGLFLVSIYNSTDEVQVNEALEKLRREHDPQSWVYKK